MPIDYTILALAFRVWYRRETLSLLLMTLVVLTLSAGSASAARKLAFTVGVDIYNNLPAEKELTNSANDARAVGDQFELLGYEVTPGENSTRSQFYTLWQGFLDKISASDTVALFLSGHGVEIEGENFLLPRDVPYLQYGRQEQLRSQSINISQLLLDIRSRHPNVIILIIDACRDNPFIPPEYKRGGPDPGGLAKMEPATGEFIMYSAAAGQTALDRLPGEEQAEHSVYVRNLLPLMEEANLTLQDLAQTLRRKVYEQAQSASHQQWPAYYDGLLDKFCLVECAAASESALPPPARVTGPVDPAALEAGLNLRPEDRTVIQQALAALGFDTRGTDGVFGANTRRAIISWQREKGQEPTGFLTSSQYGKLLAEAEPKLAALESARRKPEPASPVQPAVGIDQYQPGEKFRDCDDCPLMVVVPAGPFMMGSAGAEAGRDSDEGPQHRVTIAEPFAVGKYEVTFDEWEACVAGSGCNGYKPDDQGWGRGRRPVINVSWDDAQAYVEWLKRETRKPYRLLSEAEWEYAARAGTTTRFWWGDKVTSANANYGSQKTTEVGSYPPNSWRLHDTAGNVWEWVEDCYHNSYEDAGRPDDGSAWTSGDCGRRVLRGGSWYGGPGVLRSADRNRFGPDYRFASDGFRVARTLTP